MRIGLVVAGVVCAVGLAGCAGGVVGGVEQQAASSSAGVRLTGVVHGGQNPITGARVYLLAAASGAGGAGQAAYGGSGIAASSNNASVSLLTSAGNTTLDQSGGATNGDYYVTTDSNGNFSITGDYTCTAGQQVYLYALGGNPGLGTGANAAAGLMAALGNCPGGSSAFAAGTPYVVVNEVSTVAAAYAMAGFATDALHVGSSGTALALTGIANAFANAGNLETLSTGVALATTPAGNGTVPQAEINTLADVLAACVNSNGAGSGCSTLFANALAGGTTGAQPGDTATAAINIAHNPGAGVAALYGLSTASPPFAGGLTAQPNDWTVGISFIGGGLAYPSAVAVDGSGNAWVASRFGGGSNYNGNVTKFSSAGAVLSPSTGFIGAGLAYPTAIAIDKTGNAWVANQNGGVSVGLSEFSNAGVARSPSTGYSLGGAPGGLTIAIDGSGAVWLTSSGGVSKVSSAGVELSPSAGYTGGGLDGPLSIAIDGSGNVWATNNADSTVSELSSSGAVISPSTGYTGGGLDGPWSIAMDGSGNAWVASDASSGVVELSTSGSVLSGAGGYIAAGSLYESDSIAVDGSGNAWIADVDGSTLTEISGAGIVHSPNFGYSGGGMDYPSGVAIDGSGDVWISNKSGGSVHSGSVTELIGAATPVITPICAGLPATPTANGTSNLGTRP